ncbi:MAG: VWA domain-containing protein [Alphaproteobacteria bacterium]|nr:VWA domain-containing protein [Alphaproteobacteria bacterium]
MDEIFLWPWVACILPLPILVRWVSARMSSRRTDNRTDALRVPFFHRVSGLARTVNPISSTVQSAFLAVAWICLVIAGMRPVHYITDVPIPHDARNIMLAIDLSTSMAEQDLSASGLPISRIDVVKAVVRDFIAKRAGDRLGMVVFGTTAHTLAPLSQDMKTLDDLFADVDLGIAGEQTAIGDALALSVQDTAKVPEGKKIIILLSDGYSNAGSVSVSEAIELARKQNIAVYTIGIGSTNVRQSSLFGLVPGDNIYTWDERTLRKIADDTGGQYFQAQSADDLVEVYRKIDRLETTTLDGLLVRPLWELFYYPLMAALFFWGLACYKRRAK